MNKGSNLKQRAAGALGKRRDGEGGGVDGMRPGQCGGDLSLGSHCLYGGVHAGHTAPVLRCGWDGCTPCAALPKFG